MYFLFFAHFLAKAPGAVDLADHAVSKWSRFNKAPVIRVYSLGDSVFISIDDLHFNETTHAKIIRTVIIIND